MEAVSMLGEFETIYGEDAVLKLAKMDEVA
jgi:hypothetical protein